jgi:hypothetical protein
MQKPTEPDWKRRQETIEHAYIADHCKEIPPVALLVFLLNGNEHGPIDEFGQEADVEIDDASKPKRGEKTPLGAPIIQDEVTS